MVLLDIKHITKEGYIDITCRDYLDRFMNFVKELNESGVDVWIRQVVVPGVHDNTEYMSNLVVSGKIYFLAGIISLIEPVEVSKCLKLSIIVLDSFVKIILLCFPISSIIKFFSVKSFNSL